MSSKTARMEVRRLLDSLQKQIVSTSNHLQLLTEQYEILFALSQKMRGQVVSKVGKPSKVGKVKASDRDPISEDYNPEFMSNSWREAFERIMPKPEFPNVTPSDDQPQGD
jgi:hypothetical protein